MSDQNVRRSLIEILRRAKRERDALRKIVIEQHRLLARQQSVIVEQRNAMREMRDAVRELKEMAVRNGLLDLALGVKREESPLQ
jgi:hypothetical protein